MTRTKYTQEQILAVLKEAEAGAAVADLIRKHGGACRFLGAGRSSQRYRGHRMQPSGLQERLTELAAARPRGGLSTLVGAAAPRGACGEMEAGLPALPRQRAGVRWPGARCVGLPPRHHARLHPTGEADAERLRRELQQPAPRRMLERPLVCNGDRGAADDRSLAGRLQHPASPWLPRPSNAARFRRRLEGGDPPPNVVILRCQLDQKWGAPHWSVPPWPAGGGSVTWRQRPRSSPTWRQRSWSRPWNEPSPSSPPDEP